MQVFLYLSAAILDFMRHKTLF
uniref:Uncharacterized protein n=1 Tax=Anguilla anguilla TaxID=7936 RepID=A0A0E9QMN7_ANGAN